MESVTGKLPIAEHRGGAARQGPDPSVVGLLMETPTRPPKQLGKDPTGHKRGTPFSATPLH